MTTQLLPPLKPDELAALRDSIARDGVIVPVLVRTGGELIDGHHRRMVAAELGVPCPEQLTDVDDETADRWRLITNLARRHLTDHERWTMLAAIARPLVEQAQKEARERQGHGQTGPGRPLEESASSSGRGLQSRDVAAAALADEIKRIGAPVLPVSGKTLAAAMAYAELSDECKAPAVASTVHPSAVLSQHRKDTARTERATTKATAVALIEATPADDLDQLGTYDVLYVDPPWRYEHAPDDSRAVENHYPTMTLDALKALRPPAGDDAVLLMWATSPKLAEALDLMAAWEFDYRTSMVWVKDRIGMGYYARQRHELLLIGKRGDARSPDEEDRPDSVIEAPRGAHSAKPPIVYDLIGRMFAGRTKVELFARTRRPGWAAWGNQA